MYFLKLLRLVNHSAEIKDDGVRLRSQKFTFVP